VWLRRGENKRVCVAEGRGGYVWLRGGENKRVYVAEGRRVCVAKETCLHLSGRGKFQAEVFPTATLWSTRTTRLVTVRGSHANVITLSSRMATGTSWLRRIHMPLWKWIQTKWRDELFLLNCIVLMFPRRSSWPYTTGVSHMTGYRVRHMTGYRVSHMTGYRGDRVR
jgi:hypothetical protein